MIVNKRRQSIDLSETYTYGTNKGIIHKKMKLNVSI